MTNWILIIGMACITFGVRYFFFIKRLPIGVNNNLQQLLSFSAPAVLTALWIPIVFFPNQTLQFDLSSPYLISALTACVLGLLRIGTLKVIIAAMLCFWILKSI